MSLTPIHIPETQTLAEGGKVDLKADFELYTDGYTANMHFRSSGAGIMTSSGSLSFEKVFSNKNYWNQYETPVILTGSKKNNYNPTNFEFVVSTVHKIKKYAEKKGMVVKSSVTADDDGQCDYSIKIINKNATYTAPDWLKVGNWYEMEKGTLRYPFGSMMKMKLVDLNATDSNTRTSAIKFEIDHGDSATTHTIPYIQLNEWVEKGYLKPAEGSFEEGGCVYTDQYGKCIVYDSGAYKISVDNPASAKYIALWYENKKVGELTLGTSREADTKGYLQVQSVEIEKKHRGRGFGKKMYQIAIKYSDPATKGIASEYSQRSNKKQVPSILKSLGGEELPSGNVLIKRENAFSEGGQLESSFETVDEVINHLNEGGVFKYKSPLDAKKIWTLSKAPNRPGFYMLSSNKTKTSRPFGIADTMEIIKNTLFESYQHGGMSGKTLTHSHADKHLTDNPNQYLLIEDNLFNKYQITKDHNYKVFYLYRKLKGEKTFKNTGQSGNSTATLIRTIKNVAEKNAGSGKKINRIFFAKGPDSHPDVLKDYDNIEVEEVKFPDDEYRDGGITGAKFSYGDPVEITQTSTDTINSLSDTPRYKKGIKGVIHSIRKDDSGKIFYDLNGIGMGIGLVGLKDVPEEHLKLYNSETKEKVEKILDEKQAGKEFKDVGKRVSGSKKEKRAYTMITFSDLADIELDEITAQQLVTKDKVYPEINVVEQQEMGVNSGAAFLKVEIRKACGSKPPNEKSKRRAFVRFIDMLSKGMHNLKTVQEVLDYLDTFRDSKMPAIFVLQMFFEEFENPTDEQKELSESLWKQKFTWNRPYEVFKKTISEVFGKRFENFIFFRSDSAVLARQQARDYEAVSPEQESENRQKHINQQTNYINANKKNIEEYEKASPEELKRKFVHWRGMDFYKKDMEGFRKAAIEYYQRRLKEGEAALEKFPDNKKARPEDWSWFESPKERRVAAKSVEPTINTWPPLHYIKRTGGLVIKPEYLEAAQNTDPDKNPITRDFGFKSVQFGNALGNKEAKEHIRHFLGAITDLAEILDINIEDLNAIGGLSIAFAARGSRGAAAHYERGRCIINITNSNGDGSLAHEYGHYLDNAITMAGKNKTSLNYGSEIKRTRLRNGDFSVDSFIAGPAITEAMAEIMDFIYKGKEGITPKVNKWFPAIQVGEHFIVDGKSNEMKNVPTYFDEVDKKFVPVTGKETLEETINYLWTRTRIVRELNYSDQVAQAKLIGYAVSLFGKDSATIPYRLSNHSAYYYYSEQMSSRYWVQPWELLARAWECYIFDKLQKAGRSSNYLVDGSYFESAFLTKKGGSSYVYPQAAERAYLFGLFEKFVAAIKSDFNLSGFKTFTEIREDEYKAFEEKKEDGREVFKKGGNVKKDFLSGIGEQIKKIVNSKRGYEILDSDKELEGSTWGAGGCYLLARAIKKEIFPDGKLKFITDADTNLPQHVVVEYHGKYFDNDGAKDSAELEKFWKEKEGINNPKIENFDNNRIGSIGIGTEQTVAKLAELFSAEIKYAEGGSIDSDEIFFSKINEEYGEVAVYPNKIRQLFYFVGEGVEDVRVDSKQNQVFVVFYQNAWGGFEPKEWNKLVEVLDKMKGKNGFSDFLINTNGTVILHFDNDYDLGEYGDYFKGGEINNPTSNPDEKVVIWSRPALNSNALNFEKWSKHDEVLKSKLPADLTLRGKGEGYYYRGYEYAWWPEEINPNTEKQYRLNDIAYDKLVNDLRNRGKEYYTSDDFENWWSKTRISDDSKEYVIRKLKENNLLK